LRLIKSLEKMYKRAISLSENNELTPKEQEPWSRLAAYIAQTINNVTRAYDEVEIEKAIQELREYVRQHIEPG
jgi:hypothetical protein